MTTKEKSQAKEVAKKEVLSRVVTIGQAKENFKAWIKEGISRGGFEQHTIAFWAEVYKQVDEIAPE
ncbi:MAG: hypothetical protein IPJ00_22630 [Saprospirales bacterium]|nr:hypothetical protein [Saprospirales bacterium]